MSKHILDQHRSDAADARMVRFTTIEAGQKPSPQTKMLQRRSQKTDPQIRTKRFLEIARRGLGGV